MTRELARVWISHEFLADRFALGGHALVQAFVTREISAATIAITSRVVRDYPEQFRTGDFITRARAYPQNSITMIEIAWIPRHQQGWRNPYSSYEV